MLSPLLALYLNMYVLVKIDTVTTINKSEMFNEDWTVHISVVA
jgi:hypothetical protein